MYVYLSHLFIYLWYISQSIYLFIKIEYAEKAVENSGTAIGIRGKDGVVFAVEKIVTSKLYEKGANRYNAA